MAPADDSDTPVVREPVARVAVARRRPAATRRPGRRPRAIPPLAWRLGLAELHPMRLVRRLSSRAQRRLLVVALVLSVLAPLWIINSAVAFFGRTLVFPLSPFFLREKLTALASYAAHRPLCLGRDHPEMGPIIAQAEVRQRLPRGFLAAVIEVESGFRPHRISPAGAMGPGQLMPDTARLLGVSDPFDTQQNVDGAARLLRQHLNRFHNLRLALAAYHAGPGAVNGHVPNNGVTPDYVARIMRIYRGKTPSSTRRPARLTLAP